MNKSERSGGRRGALKALAASGLVAGSTVEMHTWMKPVVQSVILPAHAVTSDNTLASIGDPCFLDVICGDGTVGVRATGRVVGSGNVSGLTIDVAMSVDGSTQTRQAQSDANGDWGPVSATFNATQGTAFATVSSPQAQFSPDSCRAPFDCSEDQPNRDQPDACSDEWDKSSFTNGSIDCQFFSAHFCNGTGSEAALCPVDFDVYYSSNTQGQPPRKSGQPVLQGQVTDVPIQPGDCRTIDLSGVVAQHGDGRYEVVVHQHPGHPGTGLVPLGDCIVSSSG